MTWTSRRPWRSSRARSSKLGLSALQWLPLPLAVWFLQAAEEMRRTFVTGFTAMTEKFSTAMYMDRGAEQLVEILNHYISAIVESECPWASDLNMSP